jgi:uncharacterized protein (TIGR03437 family)
MQTRRLKLGIFLCISILALIGLQTLEGTRVRANTNIPPTKSTGAPGEQNCASCHTGTNVNSGGGVFTLTGVPASYQPNQQVTLVLTLSQAGRVFFGFEITAVDDAGRAAGTLSLVPGGNRTALGTDTVAGNQRQYVSQTLAGSAPTGGDVDSWNFIWKAPAQSVGRVTFYASGVASNSNGAASGDSVYTLSQSSQSAGGGATVAAIANTSAASFVANGTVAAQSIVAAFGAGLCQNTVAATTATLPTTLDGAQVRVRDAANTERVAGLFFVSPGQFNYLVPQGTANGVATVTIARNGTTLAQGTLSIDTVAPALFSANADGLGVPAAVLLRVRNGVSTFEAVSRFNSTTRRFEPAPIDLGLATDQVFLILFGSGFRNNTALSAASATIGGAAATVMFAGAQGQLAGLDQANLLLPRSLAGRGLVNLSFVVAGKMANVMQVSVK